jgi:hypothetical protein
MTSNPMVSRERGLPVPDESVIVIGAGRFGKRAVRILSATGGIVTVVDKDPEAVSSLAGDRVIPIVSDGVAFMRRSFTDLSPETLIVPALPVHLAYEWLSRGSEGAFGLERTVVPEGIAPSGVHCWPATEGSVLVSYADFICPDDCPEPERCTVTGERRELPLYRRLQELRLEGWQIAVIRSRQLAPGLGGYRARDLKDLAERVKGFPEGPCLICTSCSCHGVITACRKVKESKTKT